MKTRWLQELLRVSIGAQRLWLHLAAEADENGVVENAREIRLRISADDDEVRELMNTGLVSLTEDQHVRVRFYEGKRPVFVTKANGITYVQVFPFVAGYGFIENTPPVEVALAW